MNLSAPTTVVFIISLVIAIVGMLAGFGILTVLPVSSILLMVIGYVVLALGCLLKGV